MQLKSPRFKHGEPIPALYTCDSDDINPPLLISDVPSEAKSLVLIMDDPDVPAFIRPDRMWVHWVIIDMPPATRELKENTKPPGTLGNNSSGTAVYQGPCPPDREHRYFFKLYALDTLLGLKMGATKVEVEKAMQGHILAQTELMGRYVRAE